MEVATPVTTAMCANLCISRDRLRSHFHSLFISVLPNQQKSSDISTKKLNYGIDPPDIVMEVATPVTPAMCANLRISRDRLRSHFHSLFISVLPNQQKSSDISAKKLNYGIDPPDIVMEVARPVTTAMCVNSDRSL